MAKLPTAYYINIVTYYVSEDALERSTQRAKRRAQRGLARSSAKNAFVEMIDELRKEGPPDWFGLSGSASAGADRQDQ